MPCGEGQGDCDDDDECAPGLKCGKSNCNSNFYEKADCCYKGKQYGVAIALIRIILLYSTNWNNKLNIIFRKTGVPITQTICYGTLIYMTFFADDEDDDDDADDDDDDGDDDEDEGNYVLIHVK